VINRRNFLLGAAGMAAIPFIPRIIPPASAADSSLLWRADMETASFSDYSRTGGPSISSMHASGNTPVISSEQARIGKRSLKCFLSRADSPTSFRTEVSTAKNLLEFNKTHWFGFSIYTPADWQISNCWEVLWQLHHHPADWSKDVPSFSPILAIRIDSNSDRYLIRQHFVQTPESQHQASDRQLGFATTLPGAVAKGRWTDWVVEYRPDWRSRSDGGTGVTRIWRDGVRVIDYQGPNAVNAKYTPYYKFGAYKSLGKDRSRNDPVKERLYYFDEVRVSRGNQGSYDMVAPGGSNQTAQPPLPPGSVTIR
jgi:hypothetical protein